MVSRPRQEDLAELVVDVCEEVNQYYVLTFKGEHLKHKLCNTSVWRSSTKVLVGMIRIVVVDSGTGLVQVRWNSVDYGGSRVEF
mmetsp:Transcript_18808/g.51534  ORF Transcript_18808/g.51534 Transcript_18808/m.51534 type:complete len:84 (+) Transcript_18808:555-806(+)